MLKSSYGRSNNRTTQRAYPDASEALGQGSPALGCPASVHQASHASADHHDGVARCQRASTPAGPRMTPDVPQGALAPGSQGGWPPGAGVAALSGSQASFVPTAGQAAALASFREFLAAPGPGVFTLCGYAGTGKSTLVQHLVNELPGGLPSAIVVAPTAKAVSVLRRKGFPFAMTVHKAFYRSVRCVDPYLHGFECECSNKTTWIFAPPNMHNVQLIVVDESSMVGQTHARDLCSLPTKILAIGDKFQLPPTAVAIPF
jgi:AAA domain